MPGTFDPPNPRYERSGLVFDLHETAEMLTTATDDLDMVWLEEPATYVAIGFMLRCQRLVRGMASLIEDGLLDAAVVLVRPTIETAVTGIWLLETGRDGVAQLMGFDRKQARKFIASVTGEEPQRGPWESSMGFWFERAEDRQQVPLKKRAGKLFPWLQKIHFDAHSWIHATVRASFLAFESDDIEKDPERREWAGLLPRNHQGEITNAAVVALLFGRELHRRLGWNAAPLDDLLEGLGADPQMLALFD